MHLFASASTSQLSETDKVIRRPTKASNYDKSNPFPSPSPYTYIGGSEQGPKPMEINDLHFPRLPSKTSGSASSSVSSQQSYKEQTKGMESSSKSVLLSRAQNAYHQQYDDAEGAQRWEECKQKLSEHYIGNLAGKKDSPQHGTGKEQVINDTPSVPPRETAKPRIGRSFPVRLLSNPDDSEEPLSLNSSQNIGKAKVDQYQNRNITMDFDETVLKCISSVHGDLVEKELAEKEAAAKLEDTVTVSNVVASKNEPMSLPIIGLSAEAAVFVPRSKSVTPVPTMDPAESEPANVIGPASKSTGVNSVEIKPGVKNTKRQSPSIMVATSIGMNSPLTISPSISPGISPPISQVNAGSPASSLTGSPMFITPKWPPPPVFSQMSRPPPLQPPVLGPAAPRYVGGPTHPGHLPQPPYGFPGSRMVYSVTPPTVFHMPGMPPHYVSHTSPTSNSIEDQAVIATGQPIMATSEASRIMSSNGMYLFYINNKEFYKKMFITQAGE